MLDWLCAVIDDEELVRSNYNDMDAETIERILEIFLRVNRIKDKEDSLKNLKETGKVV